jgi:hypothetical protein
MKENCDAPLTSAPRIRAARAAVGQRAIGLGLVVEADDALAVASEADLESVEVSLGEHLGDLLEVVLDHRL